VNTLGNETREDPSIPDLDAEAWRAKCREERDKRLRADGEAQYIRANGRFARYHEEDPFIAAPIAREPLTDEVDVVIVGGGFSGMMAGAYLRRSGIDSFRIIDSAGDFGGCWYWNRYPGAQCDIESYIYLPLLEETGYVPKLKYSFAAEIFEHCQRVGKHFDLYRAACFQTKVQSLAWNEETKRWLVRTDRNDAIRARFVIVAIGVGSKAKLPGIPGIEDFEGVSFHTSHWNYEFTGGDPNTDHWDAEDDGTRGTGKLDKLADKTVAVIGTGATAIQCVPFLARDAKRLYVFQRTPNAVTLRGGNPSTDPSWASSLAPGWQNERRENFEDVVAGKPVSRDLVDDPWTHMLRELRAVLSKAGQLTTEALMREAELSDYRMIKKKFHDQMESVVQDRQVAELLKPWYRPGCKRPGFNDEYLAAFNRPNVTLVDVSPSKGVERITKTGVVANGIQYDVDCIVFATGFEIAITDFRNYVGFDIVGRNGTSIFDHWKDGIRSQHGYATHGFPNWFYIGFSQNGFGFNQGYMLDEQARHVTHIIAEVKKRGGTVVEVTSEAEEEWVKTIRQLSRINRDFLESCTPGFYNNEGHLRGGLLADTYSPGVRAFNEILVKWREAGKLEGLEISE
jgi:cyclohexanone monooxygenase